MKSWSEKYRLGNEKIDEDHIVLFEIIDRSYEILLDKFSIDKYDKIINVIEELKDYTKYHFDREEELMLENKYNKFFSHKTQHIEFIKKIDGLDLKKIDEDQEKYIKELLDFVIEWLGYHILHTDNQVVKFCNSIKA